MTQLITDKLLRAVAALIVFVTICGAAWPVLVYEGSPAGKYAIRAQEVQAAGDAAFESAMAAQLYGEASSTATPPAAPSEPAKVNADGWRRLDKGLAIFCLLLAAGLPWLCSRKPKLGWLYGIPALWLLVNAQATALAGGKAFAELAVPAHATRWLLPIALAALYALPKARANLANWLLRGACAATFAVHGWEAWCLNPPFQDLMFGTAARFGVEVPLALSHNALRVIGCMDLVLALSVLTIHSRPLLAWMCFWGLLTATSRPLSIGLDAWSELAVRLPNAGAPMLLLLLGLPALIRHQRDQSSNITTTTTNHMETSPS